MILCQRRVVKIYRVAVAVENGDYGMARIISHAELRDKIGRLVDRLEDPENDDCDNYGKHQPECGDESFIDNFCDSCVVPLHRFHLTVASVQVE
jgi:hypothetical protein